MGRASRTRLAAAVGVVVALAALLAGGRLTGRALERPGDTATAVTLGRASPRAALVRKVALNHPVDGVAVWSAMAAPAFEVALRQHFIGVRVHLVEVPRGDPDHVYVARL